MAKSSAYREIIPIKSVWLEKKRLKITFKKLEKEHRLNPKKVGEKKEWKKNTSTMEY